MSYKLIDKQLMWTRAAKHLERKIKKSLKPVQRIIDELLNDGISPLEIEYVVSFILRAEIFSAAVQYRSTKKSKKYAFATLRKRRK